MAIKSNSSEQEVMGSGIKLYSGLTNMSVIAVNPTMAELHALDINVKTEPNYFLELNGTEYFKIVFWMKNSDLTTRLEILMTDQPRVSQSGKNQWINNIGQTTWSEQAPTYDWWKTEGQRHAFGGEETLINFVKAWANVASGDDVSFETMPKMVKGDVTELKTLVKLLNNNQARVLVGIKDGKYQVVYTKHFGRVKPQRDDLFVKNLNDEYGTFNAEFNTELNWGEFKPQLAVTTPDEDEKDPFSSDDENKDWV
jgi:hypothetical protein|tara:strand:- start:760 stop:1521 length:762 start_codon:yes stop_codon:yes gene_type:complete